jgi:hypothetical protein
VTSTLPAEHARPADVAEAAVAVDPHAASVCRNCGASAPGSFCAACGQTTTLHPPTVREFVHEFINHTIAFEGSLWRTLVALLLRPGLLTVEYFAGRRQRYIAPLRLYLTVSLVFFAFGVSPSGDISFGNQAIRFSTAPQATDQVVIGPRKPTDFKTGVPTLDRLFERFAAMPAADRDAKLREGMHRNLPYALIVLVPVLALFLKVAYRGRHRLYGEHLVFAFHAQTTWFLYALLSRIPLGELYASAIELLFLVQLAISLRRVYGGRIVFTILREAMLLLFYMTTVGIALALLAIVSILLALPPA